MNSEISAGDLIVGSVQMELPANTCINVMCQVVENLDTVPTFAEREINQIEGPLPQVRPCRKQIIHESGIDEY